MTLDGVSHSSNRICTGIKRNRILHVIRLNYSYAKNLQHNLLAERLPVLR